MRIFICKASDTLFFMSLIIYSSLPRSRQLCMFSLPQLPAAYPSRKFLSKHLTNHRRLPKCGSPDL